MKIIEAWGGSFKKIKITTTTKSNSLGSTKSNDVGCFFSGGVDSFYTFLKNKKEIKKFVFVHGFDIKAQDNSLFKSIEKNIIQIAKVEKLELIEVKTNIREIFDEYFGWDLAHGFALAAVGLFLQNGFKEIYLSCGQPTADEEHHYLSPELDLLWSTEKMKLNHYGCKAGKIDKLKYLANNKLAMNNLRVCWQNKNNAYNCCECEKCFRNMLALHAADTLGECKSFNKKINLDKLRGTKVGKYEMKYFVQILDALIAKGETSEIRLALEECVNQNSHPSFQIKLVNSIRESVHQIDHKYNHNRLFWFLSSKGLI